MNLNLPNSLTLFRILVIPIMVYLFLSGDNSNRIITSVLFLIAIITDYLDGVAARTMNQHTNFGKFLDPIADKLLIIIVLSLLLTENNSIFFILPALIIITREFLVIAIRQRLAELGKHSLIRVIFLSKIKTSAQMLSLFLLLYNQNIYSIHTYNLGIIFLQFASILTIITFAYYVKKSWKIIIK